MLSLGESASFWEIDREICVRFGLIKCGGFDDRLGGFLADSPSLITHAENNKLKSTKIKILNIATAIKRPLSKNIRAILSQHLLNLRFFYIVFDFGFGKNTAIVFINITTMQFS